MKKINFNRNWNFKFGENSGDETANEYGDYCSIGLPHSFGIPYLGEKDFYVGYGTYQKWLKVDENLNGKKLLLEFGAVFQVAEIFVNGIFVMRHEGGYTAFACDITDFITTDNNNIFIRVNNLWSPIIAPRSGEHVFNGGIYRDVNLLVYDSASHISWYGIFVKTAKQSEKEYEICIETETEKCDGKLLKSTIVDAVGAEVGKIETTVNSLVTVQKITISSPHLWDIDSPYLYSLVSDCDGDELITSFGVRDIMWDTSRGFFLNGRRVLLEGANVHQDHGGWCDAVTHSGIYRDIAMMKECGFNFIRGSHYPHHTEFAAECDRKGMLFWSESVFWGIGGFSWDGYWNCSAMPINSEYFMPFEASLKQTLFEMIRTNRNSPSIIAWSMGNEIFFSNKSVVSEAKKLVAELVEYTHTLDNTRLAGIGGVQRGGFDKIGDIAGYNGDGAVLFKNPSKPSIVAEYGSIPSYRPGKYELYETKGSDDYYPWRAGRAIWCGFHHGSIAEIGNLGIVDLYRLPLNAWYCIREKNRGIKPPKPAIAQKPRSIILTTDKTEIHSDGTDDCMLVAKFLDKDGNRVVCDTVVTIEVVSGSGVLPTGKKMNFSKEDKNFFDGLCAIELRSYYSGKTRVRASAIGLISNEVEINVLADTLADENNQREITYQVAPKQKLAYSRQGVNIMSERPVTVSSEKVVGSSLCLTSESQFAYWSPSSNDISPIILLDMEKCYDSFTISIKKQNVLPQKMQIFVSMDKENWLPIEKTGGVFSFGKLKFSSKIKARYVKILTDSKVKIVSIQIYETAPEVDLS